MTTDGSITRTEVFERIAAVRAERASLREDVRAGEVDFDEIFARAESNPALATMKLLPLIESIPDVGKVQSRRALAVLDLEETILVDELPAERRGELLELMSGERLTSEDV